MAHILHTEKLHQAVKEVKVAQAWAKKEFNVEFTKDDLYWEVYFELGPLGSFHSLKHKD